MDEIELRPLMPEDADAARAVVVARLAGTRYEARTLEQLDAALTFEDPEYMALLAAEPASGQLGGLVMFGAVAGAQRVTKLHALLGDDEGTCSVLAEVVRTVASESGERMVVAELPDDLAFDDAIAALRASGFHDEGRVDDFVAEGVGLRLLVWRSG
ncbi:MAG TPA: hypothetical protein VFY85_05925 [Gemmatimonadaceae bacterium]|nr:hypothetical protein [Gemmatimonadaceae bacterium]